MSEIRVDTISEKTSANGVAIDGVTIKDGGIAATDGSTITTADNTDTLTLISTDADATQGPVLNLYRNSSAVEDDNDIARINFTGNDSGGNATTYASTRVIINDVTDGTEDTQIIHSQMIGGAFVSTLRCKPDEIVINDSSIDLDFRVESNGNQDMFIVNGGDNRVGIANAPDLGVGLHIKTGDSGASVAADCDELVIEGSANAGISILTGTSNNGRISFGDSGGNQMGQLKYEHSVNSLIFNSNATEALRISTSQVLSTGGEDGPDATNGGITIDTNAEDGAAFTFKNSDVAHGITDNAQTDTYFQIKKSDNAKGGVFITSLAEDMASERMVITANGDGDLSTTKSASGRGAITIGANTKSGTGVTYVNDDGNLLTIANYTQTNFIFDAEGTFHSNVGTATYDEYDDAQLVRAMDLSTSTKGLIASKFDDFVKYNHEDLANAKIVGREEDGTPNSMVNWTAMSQLHNGAIWQQYEKTQRLTNAMYELAKAAVGEEKANEILEQNEIKLLN